MAPRRGTKKRSSRNGLEIDSLAGLPAHPLFVHAAVALVPLAVVGFLGTGWRGRWRERYGLTVVLLAVAGWAFALLAAQGGEPLEHHLRGAAQAAGEPRPRFGEHPEHGETAATLALLFAAGTAGLYGAERWVSVIRTRRWTVRAGYAVVGLIGLVALAGMVPAGHTGADLL